MIQDTISIGARDGVCREIALDGDRLRIGSAPDNDLVLDGAGVAPHHATISRDGAERWICDIGSAEGTLLDGERLLINEPQKLASGHRIQIGGWELVFQAAPRPAPSKADLALLQTLLARDLEPVEPAGQPEPPALRRRRGLLRRWRRAPQPIAADPMPAARPATLWLALSEEVARAAPGETATVTIVVANRGERTERVALALEGLPADGYTLTAREVEVAAGEAVEVRLDLHPPRGHVARAGHYTFRVVARAEHSASAEARGEIEVLPRYRYTLELAPEEGSRGAYQLTIANDSNAPLKVQLAGMDTADALRFHFARTHVVAPPGTDLMVPLRVSAGLRGAIGAPKSYPFLISATPPFDPGLARAVVGRLESRPLVPPVALALLLLALLGLAACALMAFGAPL